MSWTLDEQRAIWFAERFAFDDPRIVLQAEIPKRAVVAYFDGRSKRELVVIDRPRIAITVTTIGLRRSKITGESSLSVSAGRRHCSSQASDQPP